MIISYREDFVNLFHNAYDLTDLIHTLRIDRYAADDIFTQNLICPLAERNAALRLHTIADGDDDIEVIVVNLISLSVLSASADLI